jgi:hypothetical protein
MSHTNLKRRRNRTLSVEFLESRQLLKTITGTVAGELFQFTVGTTAIQRATFSTTGKLQYIILDKGPQESRFDGAVNYSTSQDGKSVTFTGSESAYVKAKHNQSLINVTFTGTATEKSKTEWKFAWTGTVLGGTEDYSGAKQGTLFGATGKITGAKHKLDKISMKIDVEITGK